MPEGPEVKRTVERLNRILQGKQLQEIVVEDQPWFQKQVRDDIMVMMSRSWSMGRFGLEFTLTGFVKSGSGGWNVMGYRSHGYLVFPSVYRGLYQKM